MINNMGLDSDTTTVSYGAANLVIENPNVYRTEIISAIHADLKFLADGLGDKFEIEHAIIGNRFQIYLLGRERLVRSTIK